MDIYGRVAKATTAACGLFIVLIRYQARTAQSLYVLEARVLLVQSAPKLRIQPVPIRQ